MLVVEMDLTEKQLFELEDVFADIVNVLLLDGKSLILPEDLTPAKKDSLYKEKELAVTKDNRFIEMYRFYIQNRLHFFLTFISTQPRLRPRRLRLCRLG